jgi:Xaa-Pro dipeptidase
LAAEILRQRSWISRVVAPAASAEEELAVLLKESGLDDATIGTCGSHAEFDALRPLLPGARIQPALVTDDSGRDRDLMDSLRVQLTDWEIARMELAEHAVEEGAKGLAHALTPGMTYGEMLTEVEYRARRAGAEELFVPFSKGPEAWAQYAPPGWIDGTFRPGNMVAFELNARVDGYWAQLPRTFLVGDEPTENQLRVHETACRAHDAMRAALRPGVTGGELWQAGIEVITAGGLEPWARHGHGMGLSMSEWFSVLPDDESRVQEGQSLVLHATVIDKSTGNQALVGDQYVVKDGKAHVLARSGVTHDLVPPR